MKIMPGEFLTLLGPSGSGKTTFLMMLAGFEAVTRGFLKINGFDKTHADAESRGFGMMFQGYALFPHMTVEQNIAFPLKVQKRPKSEIRDRVTDMIDLVGLSGHGHKRPSGLSGGQQQRVALARALAYEPPVLLLDEPFSALDKNLRGQMQDELRRIHAKMGTTFVFVTHDQSEALALSSRVAIFDQGKLQQLADPTTVYERPSTRFVAEFLGDINVLPAIFDGPVSKVGDFSVTLPEAPAASARHIAVRPEKLALQPESSQIGLPCVITDRIYMGAQSRLQLSSVADGSPLVIDIKTADLSSAAEPGHQIRVGWAAKDSLIF
ncbi:ABC transporter ATP-binding protein [Epibacterium ulvae]|nr:ABC transporter ATP-binding protein [Epibacterium ulvae]